jgi:chromosome segregation ATPase
MLARREPRGTLGEPPGGGSTSGAEAAPLLAELDRLRDENHRCLGWIQKLEDDNARLQADLASLFERNNAYIRSLEEECGRKDEWIKKIERDNSELSEGIRHLEERHFRQLSELHGRIGELETRGVPEAGAWRRIVRALRSRWAPR